MTLVKKKTFNFIKLKKRVVALYVRVYAVLRERKVKSLN